jgi:hypothetical protein
MTENIYLIMVYLSMLLVTNSFFVMRDEVTGEWRKLDNEELLDLYSSPSTNAYRLLV